MARLFLKFPLNCSNSGKWPPCKADEMIGSRLPASIECGHCLPAGLVPDGRR